MKERTVVIIVSLMSCMSFILYPEIYARAADTADINKLQKEVSTLKEEVSGLKKEINELKVKVAGRQRYQPKELEEATVGIDDDPVKGNNDAPVTIIEFSDFQCPYCGRFFKNTFPEIDKEYIKKGKVRYVFRDFPLEFHANAPKAAEAANCAGEQKKYWEMHDKIFDNQSSLTVDSLKEYAKELGLASGAFDSCLDSGRYVEEIKKDTEDGVQAGVSGTPSFFIGRSQKGSNEIVGKRIVGAQPWPVFKQAIDELLK